MQLVNHGYVAKQSRSERKTENIDISSDGNVAQQQQQISYHLNKNTQQKKTIAVMGDSIIKNIKGWELSENSYRVIIKSFPGATTNCMKNYVIPTKIQNRCHR